MTKMSRLILSSVAAVGLAGGVAADQADAVTATVPNYLHCSAVTGRCQQQNGAYNRTVPTHCKTVWYAIWSGNRSAALCDRWV